jgi:hypothetical protein
MTEAVVDDLESVEVEEEDCELKTRIVLRGLDGALQVSHELGAIGKIG